MFNDKVVNIDKRINLFCKNIKDGMDKNKNELDLRVKD